MIYRNLRPKADASFLRALSKPLIYSTSQKFQTTSLWLKNTHPHPTHHATTIKTWHFFLIYLRSSFLLSPIEERRYKNPHTQKRSNRRTNSSWFNTSFTDHSITIQPKQWLLGQDWRSCSYWPWLWLW